MGSLAEKGTTLTLSVGATNNRPRAGITLIELLIVMTLIALLTGIAFPSAAAGIESLRLRSVSDRVVSFLNTAIDRASRRQQVIEVWISPKDKVLISRSPDLQFSRRLDLPEGYSILSILPAAEVSPEEPRRFLLYPGGGVPRIGVEIADRSGSKRMISVDPFTELTRAEKVQ
jgi:prepilin-type N-terminal cleavage/methylation domain-containing protein